MLYLISEYIVLMAYAFYETSFNNPPSKLFVYTSRSYTPKIGKNKHSEISNERKLFNGYKRKIMIQRLFQLQF